MNPRVAQTAGLSETGAPISVGDPVWNNIRCTWLKETPERIGRAVHTQSHTVTFYKFLQRNFTNLL